MTAKKVTSRWWSLLVMLVAFALIASCSSAEEGTDAEAPTTATADGETPTTATATTASETPATATTDSERALRVSVSPPNNEEALPHRGSYNNKAFWDLFYDYLFTVDDSGAIAPQLATDWEVSDDGLTWTITLRDDVEFHHGQGPMTAEDVVFSTNLRVNDPEAPDYGSYISNVSATDSHTVTIELSRPWVTLGYVFSDQSRLIAPIVSKSYVESVGEETASQEPVGTGPFEWTAHSSGVSMDAVRFEDYWGEMPGAASVTMLFVPEEATRFAQLEAGEVDIAELSRRTAQEAEGRGYTAWRASTPTSIFMNFNGLYLPSRDTFDPTNPFLDERVRQALNIAIDRQTIADTIFLGQAEPNAVVIPRSSPAFDDSWEVYPYDPEQAQALLEEAGVADLQINVRSFSLPGVPELPDMAAAVAGYFQAIGVETVIESMDFTAHREDLLERTLSSSYMDPWRIDVPTLGDSLSYMRVYYHSEGLFGGWESPELDALIEAAEASADLEELGERISDIGDFMHTEYVSVPIGDTFPTFTSTDAIGNWRMGFPDLRIETVEFSE